MTTPSQDPVRNPLRHVSDCSVEAPLSIALRDIRQSAPWDLGCVYLMREDSVVRGAVAGFRSGIEFVLDRPEDSNEVQIFINWDDTIGSSIHNHKTGLVTQMTDDAVRAFVIAQSSAAQDREQMFSADDVAKVTRHTQDKITQALTTKVEEIKILSVAEASRYLQSLGKIAFRPNDYKEALNLQNIHVTPLPNGGVRVNIKSIIEDIYYEVDANHTITCGGNMFDPDGGAFSNYRYMPKPPHAISEFRRLVSCLKTALEDRQVNGLTNVPEERASSGYSQCRTWDGCGDD